MTHDIDRRSFLVGASALALPKCARPTANHVTLAAAAGTMSAVVSLDGKTLVFEETAGEDLGDYHGLGFVQRCVRVLRADTDLVVYFRPDRDSDRAEVVFELGRLWGERNRAAANLGAYRVAIKRGGSVLAEIAAKEHFWFAAWRWQSSPRPVVRSPAELMEKRLLPLFSAAAARNAVSTVKPPVYAGPMDNAGVRMPMPDPGDRPDLGIVTELQGDFIVTQNSLALQGLLAQAEAAGSVPWHMRDEKTGAPVDFYAHPKAHWYQRPYETPGEEYINRAVTPWHVDDAHQPSLAYVAFVLTDDPYYLEKLQFQHGFNLGWSLYHRIYDGQGKPVFAISEGRGYAWALRTGAEAARASPAEPPKWLLSKGYYERVLEDNLAYFERLFSQNPDPTYARFHVAVTPPDEIASWQDAFLASAIGLCVILGFNKWRPVFEWKLASLMALSNGKSGWNRQWCCPYYYSVLDQGKTAYADWRAVWEGFKHAKNPPIDESAFPTNGAWAQGVLTGQSWQFLEQVRGPLALGAQLGVNGAAECKSWLDKMIDGELARIHAQMDFRWAFA